jgi:hypothetical protein
LFRAGVQAAVWPGHLPVIADPKMKTLGVTLSYSRRQRENQSPASIPAFMYGFRPAFTASEEGEKNANGRDFDKRLRTTGL